MMFRRFDVIAFYRRFKTKNGTGIYLSAVVTNDQSASLRVVHSHTQLIMSIFSFQFPVGFFEYRETWKPET